MEQYVYAFVPADYNGAAFAHAAYIEVPKQGSSDLESDMDVKDGWINTSINDLENESNVVHYYFAIEDK